MLFAKFIKVESSNYVDARGVTSCFDEFMEIANDFVNGEFIIRPVTEDDISEWEKGFDYNDEAYMFSEAIIKKYKSYYTIW